MSSADTLSSLVAALIVLPVTVCFVEIWIAAMKTESTAPCCSNGDIKGVGWGDKINDTFPVPFLFLFRSRPSFLSAPPALTRPLTYFSSSFPLSV